MMARAMCKLKHKTLAERYLKNAREDKKKLDELERLWKLDVTKTLV
jgi:ABC-type Zn uptake system ZnuABC Zn-binding protein ZnuA